MSYKIEYVVGDITATKFDEDIITLISHICNDSHIMGSGLAKALYTKWDKVKAVYELNKKKLGRFDKVRIDKNLYVMNLIAQSDPGGYKPKYSEYIPAIRYECLYECLIRLREDLLDFFNQCELKKEVNFWTGLIGSERAGGNWTKITETVYSVLSMSDLHWNVRWYCLSEEIRLNYMKQDYSYESPERQMLRAKLLQLKKEFREIKNRNE